MEASREIFGANVACPLPMQGRDEFAKEVEWILEEHQIHHKAAMSLIRRATNISQSVGEFLIP